MTGGIIGDLTCVLADRADLTDCRQWVIILLRFREMIKPEAVMIVKLLLLRRYAQIATKFGNGMEVTQ